MDTTAILTALDLGEEKDCEFKAARGGLPKSLWETYSAMANTDGGIVILGVAQRDDQFVVEGVPNPRKLKQEFWDNINNRVKVSTNLLSNDTYSRTMMSQSRRSPAVRSSSFASREPPGGSARSMSARIRSGGTFRRYQEGDYRCSHDEVGRMFADQSEEPADGVVLDHFGMDDIDSECLNQYRNRFSAREPSHPWLALDGRSLLEKLGGWRTDRPTGRQGLTVAGLLMFGKDEAIRDQAAVPQYHIDYRERLSDNSEVRWTDRLRADGTWTANLFQFYQKVILRLFADLKVPFRLGPDMFRRDETIVHEAVREALVNALIHADYRGQGGVVIEKYRDRITLANPGSLLLPIEQLYRGGVSECRNKWLQKMFDRIGGGEQAGSGIDKIRQGWASQTWQLPLFEETTRPDRVQVILPMVSLLPEASLEKLHQRLGPSYGGLGPEEVQALVMADAEGEVTNLRLRQVSDSHPTDVTKLLQGLLDKGLLNRMGHGRATTYSLAGPLIAPQPDSGHGEPDSGHGEPDSGHGEPDSGHGEPTTDPVLLGIAKPARDKSSLKPALMQTIIRALCVGHELTLRQLALLVNREANGLQRWTLRPMAKQGQLRLKHPEAPNHPRQAYRTNPSWPEGGEEGLP